MRNVICAINLTLYGCCGHTKFNPDEGTHEYVALLYLKNYEKKLQHTC